MAKEIKVEKIETKSKVVELKPRSELREAFDAAMRLVYTRFAANTPELERLANAVNALED